MMPLYCEILVIRAVSRRFSLDTQGSGVPGFLIGNKDWKLAPSTLC